jgi:Spy/CpxP family protein refolding chaperone
MKSSVTRTIIGKGFLLIIFSAVVLHARAYAQSEPSAGFDPAAAFETFMSDCSRELSLTRDQETRMRSILQEQFTEQKAYREKMRDSGNKDYRAMKKEMDRIREKTDTRLKTVLNEEQMKKFKDLREKQREEMRQEIRKKRSMP